MNRILSGLAIGLGVAAIVYFGGLGVQKEPVIIEESAVGEAENSNKSRSSGQLQCKDIKDEELYLLATSSHDAKAVVRDVGGVSKVVSVGDQLGSRALVVTEISMDKIVLKNSSSNEVHFLFVMGKDGKSKRQTLYTDINVQTPNPIIPITDTAEQPNS